ncbi:uncharacterized protein F4812DRAFT_428035 [Daldinia caldariorum]|uniref:uncharacterized protein n=1 Tax=Daldinia caldariorum TaxID=326644 RepID=UPI002008DBC0|nr:uncharacterized protein F4812DRAFT_428035 [Daldinia caldariorum]KAI1467900.1 hypothetical protein F4812DRAFT_428035 [Daldinia caldariorum]
MSAFDIVNALHAEALRTIRPIGRDPTRAEQCSALELADRAIEIALEAGFDGSAIEACRDVQKLCYEPLLRAYSWVDNHERRVYQKNSSRTPVEHKRSARLYDVDKGEHVIEALEAVHIGNMLSNRESVDPNAWSRKIRWVDEVRDQPIRTLAH